MLQKHQGDVDVCKFILSAIGNLCIVSNNRQRLGVIGVCECVVAAALTHLDDRDTATAAALCVSKLCEHISVLLQSAALSTSYKSYMASMNSQTSSDNVTNTMVISNRVSMFEAGCCEMIVTAMTFHGTETQAATILCDAIFNFASCNDVCNAEREALGKLGACMSNLIFATQL